MQGQALIENYSLKKAVEKKDGSEKKRSFQVGRTAYAKAQKLGGGESTASLWEMTSSSQKHSGEVLSETMSKDETTAK